jgi:hypothetical protein
MEICLGIDSRYEIKFLEIGKRLCADEHVNADVKYGVGSKTPKRTKERLREAVEEHMEMLQNTPKRIVRYFRDPAISYAADV